MRFSDHIELLKYSLILHDFSLIYSNNMFYKV